MLQDCYKDINSGQICGYCTMHRAFSEHLPRFDEKRTAQMGRPVILHKNCLFLQRFSNAGDGEPLQIGVQLFSRFLFPAHQPFPVNR